MKLQKKEHTYRFEKVCIGNTLDIIQDVKYNNNLHNSVKLKYGKNHGCEIEFKSVEPIVCLGMSNARFRE